MNKFVKKASSFILCALLVVFLSVPSFAAESAGNGYHLRDIVYNGKTYEAALAANYNSTYGACSIASCQAYITVWMKPVTVTYDTKNYGYITDTGTGKIATFSSGNTSIYTPYVECSKGIDQMVYYVSISGSAVFYGDSAYTLNARANA